MANIAILGVYSTKTALDTAEKATASNGDTYIVGSKIPYELYTYSSSKSAFEKGDKVSNVASDLSTPISIDDVTEPISLSSLPNMTFKNANNENVKFINAIGKRKMELYEIVSA